jgi:polyisoprenoid-binding protein YceI
MMRRLAFVTVLAVSAAMAADSRAIDAAKSSLVATFTQMNVPVEGQFKAFSGTVSYDPANAAAASAKIEIDTASFDLGDDDYNAEVRKAEWFDSKTHPKASFVSTSVKSLGTNRFEASGTFSLKGKTQTLTVPVSVVSESGLRRYEGQLNLSRAAFGIGGADWKDVLDDKVVVRFRIVTPNP